MSTPDQAPLVLPRGLIFMSALWLIGSWILSIGFQPPVHPSSASYTPGVRMMLQCIMVGLMFAWPMLRLSQPPLRHPLRQTLLDVVVLLALVQIVLWLLRMVTSWSVSRVAAIDATIAGWVMMTGAFIAAGSSSTREGPRTLAMLACVCLSILGPALAWVGAMRHHELSELIGLSPMFAVRTLTEGGGAQPTPLQWNGVTVLAAAAFLVWGVLTAVRVIQKRPRPS